MLRKFLYFVRNFYFANAEIKAKCLHVKAKYYHVIIATH